MSKADDKKMELIEEGFLNTVTSVESALIASISTNVNSPSEVTIGVNLAFEKTGAKRTINEAITKSAVDALMWVGVELL